MRQSGERLDDSFGNRGGVLVEHKVAAIEIAQVGCRHKLLHEFRSRRPDERVISPPHDERLRLLFLSRRQGRAFLVRPNDDGVEMLHAASLPPSMCSLPSLAASSGVLPF